MRTIDELLSMVCSFLNKEEIEYVIVGGLAVVFHGVPRTTMDIDMILNIKKEEEIIRFLDFLRVNDFFVSIEDVRSAFREKSHSTIQDKRSMLRLDIKGVYDKRDEQTLERKLSFSHLNTRIYIASPEDVIANKLLFGSEQDIKDAEGIYVRQLASLDMKYLKKFCKEMGVKDELTKMEKRIKKYLEKEGKNRI